MHRSIQHHFILRPQVLLAAMIFSIALNASLNAQTLTAGITPSAYETLKPKLNLENSSPATISVKNCFSLEDDRIFNSGRMIVEVLILCNSVFEAGIAQNIELVHHLPHKRRLKLVADGKIDTSGLTIFPEGLANIRGKNQPLLSNSVIQVGEFEKAVFTLPNRKDVLSVGSLRELQEFKAVMVKFWRVDMKTLKAMNLKSLVGVLKPDKYVDILRIGRADFTISEFTSASSLAWAKGLVRIPNIKVALLSPRIFPISPKRRDIMVAINNFLQKNRANKNDIIKSAFQKSGFINKKFANWRLLFPKKGSS